MKYKIKYSSKWVPKGFIGITLYPTIHIAISKEEYIMRYGSYRLNKTLNHEKIHLYQQREMLILPFYIWYFLEWLIKFIIYVTSWVCTGMQNGKLKSAYKNISFEREAFNSDENLVYLDSRKKFNWINYIFKK